MGTLEILFIAIFVIVVFAASLAAILIYKKSASAKNVREIVKIGIMAVIVVILAYLAVKFMVM